MALSVLPPARPLGALAALVASAWLLLGASGCATYQDDLNRSIKYYDGNEHERSLAVLRSIEHDIDSLKPDERVRYYYYRGMTDFRLTTEKYDISADARHWLGLAKAGEDETPSSLNEKQIELLKDTLDKLNRKVYGLGDNDEVAHGGEDADKDKDKATTKSKSKAADKDKDKDDDGDKPKKKKKKAADE
jgi:hypothetical protein